jgi:hypothetical protein
MKICINLININPNVDFHDRKITLVYIILGELSVYFHVVFN